MGIEERLLEWSEQVGIEKGKTELRTDMVRNFIINHGFTPELTARLINVSMPFVKRVMKNNKPRTNPL